jgi:putative transcriptional regulator
MSITESEPANLTGSLLVALPTLLDPNFRRTILFLVNHDPSEGAMGVILNRPKCTRFPEPDDNPGIPSQEESGRVPVFEGGPVERQQLILARMIVADTSTSFEALGREDGEALLEKLPEGDFRAFVGYAGWIAGQLEREIAEKSWIILPPSPALLTAAESAEEGAALWLRVMKSLGPWCHLMALAPDDLSLN